MNFKVAIPTTDYSIVITDSGGITITFTNAVHYSNFKSYIQCGKYPKICFDTNGYHIYIGNYVLRDNDNSISMIFFLNSGAWGNGIKDKSIPLYFIVG